MHGRSKRMLLLLGAGIAAGAGALVAVLSPGGSHTSALPTTGASAPLTVHRQRIFMVGDAVIGDPEPGKISYLSPTLSPLPARRHYRLTVTNTSDIGFIDSFQWYPPTGIRILSVTGSSAGRCELTGLHGFGGNQFKTVVLYPNILCEGVHIKPPSCTCRGDGGSVSISFVLDRTTGQAGVARMISATPVLKPIPSYLSTP